MTRPMLFLLHALGASAREWAAAGPYLDTAFDVVALDLPGFGDAAFASNTSVSAMTDWLADEIRARDPVAYLLVGHSMGGKLATLVAARAEAGEQGLSALAGVVLLAASPPSPEPMDEDRRAEMIGWFVEGQASEEQARHFVDANVAASLPAEWMEQAVCDVRRSGRQAWLAWLERGSREDWSGAVTVPLATPALIVAGAEDGDLGEEAQRRLNAPLYRDVRVETVPDAAHLLPYEQPQAIAELIATHWRAVERRTLPSTYARLLASDRVSARTRAALVGRLNVPAVDGPACLNARQRTLLAAMVARVLPRGRGNIDLVDRIDANLAAGAGDGWRFAALPDDATAWKAGLDTLDALLPDFACLAPAEQDAALRRLEAGESGSAGSDRLDGAQMRLWFEDVRAETVRTWLAHPASMARIGYDGFANGGDGARLEGYQRTGADDPEPWEPAPAGRAA